MGLGSRARRLVVARGILRGPVDRRGLVWSSTVVRVDDAALLDGEHVVIDATILQHRDDGEPSTSEHRERVTRDPEERGKVYAWDGRVVGEVRQGERGGVLLVYTWPEGLAGSAPVVAAGS